VRTRAVEPPYLLIVRTLFVDNVALSNRRTLSPC
jgi:hypothetical protein